MATTTRTGGGGPLGVWAAPPSAVNRCGAAPCVMTRRTVRQSASPGPVPVDDPAPGPLQGDWRAVVMSGQPRPATRSVCSVDTTHSSSSSSSETSSATTSPVMQSDDRKKRWATLERSSVDDDSGDEPTVVACYSPPPAFLGEPMFRRESSLQKLVERLCAEDTTARPQQQQQQQQQRNLRRRSQNQQRRATGSDAPRPQRKSDNHSANSNSSSSNNSSSSGTGIARATTNAQRKSPDRGKKCGDKRDFFFRHLEFETRNRLQVDKIAAYSVTDYEMATKISEAVFALFNAPEEPSPPPSPTASKADETEAACDTVTDMASIAAKRIKYPLTVTDGTACVGGNVLSFCDYFTHVNAVECDLTRFEMLQHNLAVLDKTNAVCLHASYLDVMYSLHQDVVFIDPPWGGPEYKDLDQVDLFLDGIPLDEICERLRGHTKCVVLKVPTNFDSDKFTQHVQGHVTVRKDLKKMHLVILDYR